MHHDGPGSGALHCGGGLTAMTLKLSYPATAEDYRARARARLPRFLFDYLDGGATDEQTLRANETEWDGIKLRQRVLIDVDQVDTTSTLAGETCDMPVVLAPLGLAGMMARRGEVQAARSAEAAGIPFTLSTVGICPVEEVQTAVSKAAWFQLYMMKDRGYVQQLLARAKESRVTTLVVTVDLARLGSRYRDIRNGFDGPQSVAKRWARIKDLLSHPCWVADVAIKGKPLLFGNLNDAVPDAKRLPDFKRWVDQQFDPSVDWEALRWLRQNWSGRLIVKGIMDQEDIAPAVDVGVDGIILSNHGGRQLDSVMPTAKKLPVIRNILDSLPSHGVELWVDGGIHSGLDVAKALALGADGCLLGRAWAFALAARGERGVNELLQRITDELRVAMTLTGVNRVADFSAEQLEQ